MLQPEKLEFMRIIEAAIFLCADRWLVCSTEQGRLSRVLKSAQKSDAVALFYGGEVPYILRPYTDGTYEFWDLAMCMD